MIAVLKTEKFDRAEVLDSDLKAIALLKQMGCAIEFTPFEGGHYVLTKSVITALDWNGSALIGHLKTYDAQLLSQLGLRVITDAGVAYQFQTIANIKKLGFERHSKMTLYTPRAVVAIALTRSCPLGDRLREYFGMSTVKTRKSKARTIAAQPTKVISIATPPQNDTTIRVAYVDASVRPEQPITTIAAYLPCENRGVVKVLKMALPVQAAEAQAAAFATEQFGKIQTIYTDNGNNINAIEQARQAGYKGGRSLEYAVFKPLLDRKIHLSYIPREKNAIADTLSRLPSPSCEEGVYHFDVEVTGDKVKTIARPQHKPTTPGIGEAIEKQRAMLEELTQQLDKLMEQAASVESAIGDRKRAIEVLEHAQQFI